jgi:hypothetical protein
VRNEELVLSLVVSVDKQPAVGADVVKAPEYCRSKERRAALEARGEGFSYLFFSNFDLTVGGIHVNL